MKLKCNCGSIVVHQRSAQLRLNDQAFAFEGDKVKLQQAWRAKLDAAAQLHSVRDFLPTLNSYQFLQYVLTEVSSGDCRMPCVKLNLIATNWFKSLLRNKTLSATP